MKQTDFRDVPDELWERIEPLLAPFKRKRSGRCILPPLRPLSVGLRPRPSVADFLRARRGLQQGAVHSLPLGVDADLFPIFSKKDAKNLRHDAGFVPSLEVLVDSAF